MKRDMDLIRELLLRLEAYPMRAGMVTTFSAYEDEEVQVSGFSYDEVDYHLKLLADAGFVEVGSSRPNTGISLQGITWDGHDFLDTVRDNQVWAKTKTTVMRAAGGFTVDILKQIAVAIVKKQAQDVLGLAL